MHEEGTNWTKTGEHTGSPVLLSGRKGRFGLAEGVVDHAVNERLTLFDTVYRRFFLFLLHWHLGLGLSFERVFLDFCLRILIALLSRTPYCECLGRSKL